MNRPYKNPNRWMVNYVPVMREKRWFDWLPALAAIEALAIVVWFTWLLVQH